MILQFTNPDANELMTKAFSTYCEGNYGDKIKYKR